MGFTGVPKGYPSNVERYVRQEKIIGIRFDSGHTFLVLVRLQNPFAGEPRKISFGLQNKQNGNGRSSLFGQPDRYGPCRKACLDEDAAYEPARAALPAYYAA